MNITQQQAFDAFEWLRQFALDHPDIPQASYAVILWQRAADQPSDGLAVAGRHCGEPSCKEGSLPGNGEAIDAARYRWLRDVRDYSVICERPGDLYLRMPRELDAAIDRARAADPTTEQCGLVTNGVLCAKSIDHTDEHTADPTTVCRCVRSDGTVRWNINCAEHGRAP